MTTTASALTDGLPAAPRMTNPVLAVLTRIGRSLMLPVATLPAGALLLRFGQEDMLGGHVPHVVGQHYGLAQYRPFYWLEHVANVMQSAGSLIFACLPLLFCLGVAVGFARRSDGSTALAAFVGYLTFNAASMQLFAGSSIKDQVLTPTAPAVGEPAMSNDRRWRNWRRAVDYYDEGDLLWFEVATIIQRESHGAKSIDDFCHAFHGGANNGPEVKTYTFDELVASLNAIAPYDWAKFFHERLESTAPGAPMGGIENAGWKVVMNDQKPKLGGT